MCSASNIVLNHTLNSNGRGTGGGPTVTNGNTTNGVSTSNLNAGGQAAGAAMVANQNIPPDVIYRGAGDREVQKYDRNSPPASIAERPVDITTSTPAATSTILQNMGEGSSQDLTPNQLTFNRSLSMPLPNTPPVNKAVGSQISGENVSPRDRQLTDPNGRVINH